jgi:hypothetical protein
LLSSIEPVQSIPEDRPRGGVAAEYSGHSAVLLNINGVRPEILDIEFGELPRVAAYTHLLEMGGISIVEGEG